MADKKNQILPDAVYTTAEAAQLLGVSESFLNRNRKLGPRSIRFVRLGNNLVRYRGRDLIAHLENS